MVVQQLHLLYVIFDSLRPQLDQRIEMQIFSSQKTKTIARPKQRLFRIKSTSSSLSSVNFDPFTSQNFPLSPSSQPSSPRQHSPASFYLSVAFFRLLTTQIAEEKRRKKNSSRPGSRANKGNFYQRTEIFYETAGVVKKKIRAKREERKQVLATILIHLLEVFFLLRAVFFLLCALRVLVEESPRQIMRCSMLVSINLLHDAHDF
jgi:hypothetical protein